MSDGDQYIYSGRLKSGKTVDGELNKVVSQSDRKYRKYERKRQRFCERYKVDVREFNYMQALKDCNRKSYRRCKKRLKTRNVKSLENKV